MAFTYHVMAQRDDNLYAPDHIRLIIQCSSIALLWYDYVLTLPSEVKYIWGQRFRISTVLYACCRYALLANILYLLVISNKFGDSCDEWSRAIMSLGFLGRAAIIITFTARTYIVCNRNRYVLFYLSALGLGWMVVSVIYLVHADCSGKSDIASLLLSTLMGLFEFSSALITFSRCMQTLRLTKGTSFRARYFLMLLLKQGVLYLVFTALFTVIALVLNYYAPPMTFCQRLLNTIALPLSCTLTARFLLHLRSLEKQLEKGVIGVSSAITVAGQETEGLGSLRFNITQMSSVVLADLGVEADVDDQMLQYVS